MGKKGAVGFTIVELIITITILVILTTLVVVRLSSTQVGGRDQERESDTHALATGLEIYYQNGNPINHIAPGYYPGAQQVQAASGTAPPFSEFLDGVVLASYEAPGLSASESFGVDPNYASAPSGANPDGSYNDTQARALLETVPYLYQPLQRNNTFCATYANCVKFNLYYLHEGSNAVVKIRSKHQ